MADSAWSRDGVQPHDDPSARFELEHAKIREKAIAELHLIERVSDPAVARSDSA